MGVPVFSPSPGTYATAQSVTLSTTTSGATIRYTTDGSTPSETVGTMYSGPIAVASSVTIRAVAYLSGWTTSSVSSGAYTITGTVAAPTFSPSPGTYATAQSVTLSTTTPGATIRYTTDGSTPSETVGTVYAGPIAVASSVTIRAVAYLSGWTTSSVSSGAYTITEPKVNVTVGSREVVFDWTTDRCEDLDVPDGPARFVRAADGELVLFSGNAPRYYVSRGSDFSSLKRVCGQPALVSADKRTPESYENWEWLWAVYREGDSWHAFVHNEFHDNTSATCRRPVARQPLLVQLGHLRGVQRRRADLHQAQRARARRGARAERLGAAVVLSLGGYVAEGYFAALEHRPRARRVLLLADELDPGQVEHVRKGNLRDPQRSAGRSDELAGVGRQRLQPPPDQPVRNGCIGHRLHVPAELDRQREPQLQHLPRPLHARGRLEHGSEAPPAGSTSRCRPTWCTGARSR